MLTFHFTGVDGSMTESETLTSGMVGKEILLVFDESWENLSKTVVFRAGEITRVVMNPGSTVTIPAEVLERPFGKLFVGVCGTDESGSLVIPTIMAEGPMIRYGADPIKDETARELPVWKNLQNQIGDLNRLCTNDRSNLVSAVNQINAAVTELSENSTGFHTEAAQLLVDILSRGLYTADQTAQINALADLFGVTVSEDLSHLIHYWDFRTGSLTDRIGGLEVSTSEDVTLDAAGAHVPASTSYIMFPAGTDGSSLAGHTVEVKFGEMSLNETATPMRLMLMSAETQPATQGLQWSVQRCWSTKSSLVTEFKDLQMFSGKTLLMKINSDASLLEWFLEGQLIVSMAPTVPYSHLSIGSTISGAFPLTVEYIRIYPTT